MRSSALANPRKYRLLLSRTMPVVIDTRRDHARMLDEVDRLMEKGEDLSNEEARLLRLLAVLIQDYEQRHYRLPRASGAEMIRHLLKERGLGAKDLWQVVGSKSRISEILSGKRPASKDQARKLAEFFKVGVEAFLR